MLEVRCGARGLSYRAGNPGRAAPKVPLGEARQEERDEWQRSSHGQGREIPGSISGPSFPQWENMCFSSPGIGDQEDFHSDGGPKVHHGKAPPTGRAGSGCGTHDALGCNRQSGGSHRHDESCPRREATPGKVHQGVWELQNAPIRQEPPAVLQLPEVWPHGQDMLEVRPDMSVLRWKPPFQPVQRGQAGHPEVRQLWRGTRHHQPGVFQKANLGQQSQGSTEGRPTTGSDSPDKECLDQKVCTDNGRLSTNFNCRKGTHTETYSGGCQATSSKTETRSYQDSSTRPATTDFLCTTTSTEDSRKSAMWSRPKKSIASTGGGTRSDSHRSQRGNSSAEEGLNREKAPYPSSTKDDRGSSRCAQDPLRIEGCAKKGPFQDHGCSPPVGYGNGPFQDHCCSHPNNGPFQDHGCTPHPSCSYNGPFQDHGGVHPVCSDNGPFQGHRGSQSVSPDNGPFQGHHGCTTVNPVTNTLISSTGRANYIKLVHWNAQGAISKTSAIQTTIVQDDIDIVMIQDTRYKRRPDDLPNLRIQGYHTYHRTMDEGGHGLVTLVKHTIPSEAADQVDLGDGTETLSTRIWINNKPLLLHNLYRVNGVLDVTTTLTREPRSILAGDFNARDERWCRANNPAGRLLNEQIQDLDNFCLMNHPQVWTTVYKTAIDLSIVPADMAPSTSWSIYPGLLSDHLAVQLEIQVRTTPGRVAGLKRWRTQHADWELYREHMMASTANMEWADVETNEANISRAILEAAELAIPKSSGKTSAAPYWRNNMGIRMAKNSYNSKLKAYRRHTSQANLELMQAAYKEFIALCTHVRNLSWNQWITECNGNINSADVWRRIKAAKGAAPRSPTHPRPQEEADSLCDTFAERSSSVILPEQTNNVLRGMAPERVRVITEATYEAVATDQEFTLSELEDVLHRLKDTAPGDDTVCNAMITNVPLATKYLLLRLFNQSFSEGKLPTRWKMAKIVPIPKTDKTHRPISLLPAISKVMERLVLARVKWSAQPINPYSLGFRSGIGTIDAIATLVHRAAPITTLRSGHKARAVTIFLDLEKAFELISKEVLLESAALLGIRGRLLSWLDDYLTNRTGAVHFQGKTSKVNHLSNGTPQGSSLSPVLFNMVINRLLQLDLGKKVQMTAYADDLAIHGGGGSHRSGHSVRTDDHRTKEDRGRSNATRPQILP